MKYKNRFLAYSTYFEYVKKLNYIILYLFNMQCNRKISDELITCNDNYNMGNTSFHQNNAIHATNDIGNCFPWKNQP